MKPSAASQSAFPKELEKIFRELYSLVEFTSFPEG
jgi:hypothetical protein